MTILLTPTGQSGSHFCENARRPKALTFQFSQGTKFVLFTSLADANIEALLQRVYEIYADAGMKNPFHNPEMPIRSEKFDIRIADLLGN